MKHNQLSLFPTGQDLPLFSGEPDRLRPLCEHNGQPLFQTITDPLLDGLSAHEVDHGDYAGDQDDDPPWCQECGASLHGAPYAELCPKCDRLERQAAVQDDHGDYADEDPDESPDPTDAGCPFCGGPLLVLGSLGNVEHFRCHDCGMDCSEYVDDTPGSQ